MSTSTYRVPELASSGGRELILAIIGGTMLTLALTRPKLEWLELLTTGSRAWKAAGQRGLSILAFIIGGYAYASLFLTLQKQVSPESATLIRGAALILFAYAWMTHFEPFLPNWKWRGEVIGAIVFYTACVYVAVMAGILAAALTATHESLTLGELGFMGTQLLIVLAGWSMSRLLAISTWVSAAGWLLYLAPRFMGVLERATPTRTPARSTRA
jgi:hypothetical protein